MKALFIITLNKISIFLHDSTLLSYTILNSVCPKKKKKIEACECTINHTRNIESTIPFTVSKRNERERRRVSRYHRRKKGNYTRAFHAYFFQYTVQDGAEIPSILTISPPPRYKILYNPRYFLDRFRDFVSESKRPPLGVFMKRWRERACTRIHMFEVCSLSKRTRGNGMRNGRIMRHIAGPMLSLSAPLEKLFLHRREELFRL